MHLTCEKCEYFDYDTCYWWGCNQFQDNTACEAFSNKKSSTKNLTSSNENAQFILSFERIMEIFDRIGLD